MRDRKCTTYLSYYFAGPQDGESYVDNNVIRGLPNGTGKKHHIAELRDINGFRFVAILSEQTVAALSRVQYLIQNVSLTVSAPGDEKLCFIESSAPSL